MGLFENAFDGMGGDKTFSPQESFAGLLLATAACDGHISNEEAQGLGTFALRMKLFQGFDGNKFSKMMDRLLGILKREEVEGLLERAVNSLPDELGETAFAGACDLALADQGIEEEEKEFLHELRLKLGIDRDQAQKIFKVIAVKNRG